MDDLTEIRLNMERIIESIATLELSQQKAGRVLYGERDIRLTGLIERVENIEVVIDAINGMPGRVNQLQSDVSQLIETDKRRVWTVRGAIAGFALQTTGLVALLIKVFS